MSSGSAETSPSRSIPSRAWFDGHLDLAYIALHGRDLTRSADCCGGTLQPATVTFPSLRDAGVRTAVSTLFVRKKSERVEVDCTYTMPEEAHAAALRQLAMHQAWASAGHIQLTGGAATLRDPRQDHRLKVVLALEGAAPIRSIDDAELFHSMGIRMVALAWAEGSPWAGGDQSDGDVTHGGKQLIERLDRLKVVHDVSHLSERAFDSLLDAAKGTVVASHSNCRALLPGAKFPQRHLSDAQIRALSARKNSRIGINFFSRFLIAPEILNQRRATIADLVMHIAHIEQVAGRRDLLALGSDFDSGFTPEFLPIDLQGPKDLPRLCEALSAHGWSDGDIHHFACSWNGLFE